MEFLRHIPFIAARLGLLIFAMLLAAAPATAQMRPGSNTVTTQLQTPVIENLRTWLRARAGYRGSPPQFPFKLPGLTVTNVICNLNANGLHCYENLLTVRCPSTVEVQTPNGTSTVPVDCTGPDRNGQCDCEFLSYR